MAARLLHLVVFPFPAQGHFGPLLHLCVELAARGACITLVNIDSIHDRFSTTWECPPGLDIRFKPIPFQPSFPFGMDITQKRPQLTGFISSWRQPFELLMSELQTPPCCIVADYFIPWVHEVAASMGVRSVSYFPGAASWNAIHQHLSLLLSSGDFPLQEGENKLITYIPGVFPIRIRDLPRYILERSKEELEERASKARTQADWVLVNSVYELEPQAFDAMVESVNPCGYLPVGPLFPVACRADQEQQKITIRRSLREEDGDATKWLEGKPAGSVLYVSFGSSCVLEKPQVEELLWGLIDSEHSFLFAVRPEMVEEHDELLQAFRNERGLVVSCVDQQQVLAHASVGGFLTHCGWNSVLESACAGIPILGWPQHSDQALNCNLAVDWNVGMRLAAGDVVFSRQTVEQRVREFMDIRHTRQMRDSARKLAVTASKAAAPAGSSSRAIDEFIASLRASFA